MARVDRRGPNDCWPWTGSAVHGHGQLETRDGRRRVHLYAHRVALKLAGVNLPDDMVVDHECHNRDDSCPGGETCQHRRCCNPAHLRVVTPSQNSLTGKSFAAKKARQTHCIHGHEFTAANTAYQIVSGKRPQRRCRACSNARLAAIPRKGN